MSRQDAAEKHSQMPMSLQQISGKIITKVNESAANS
jgi:hypothetical protein